MKKKSDLYIFIYIYLYINIYINNPIKIFVITFSFCIVQSSSKGTNKTYIIHQRTIQGKMHLHFNMATLLVKILTTLFKGTRFNLFFLVLQLYRPTFIFSNSSWLLKQCTIIHYTHTVWYVNRSLHRKFIQNCLILFRIKFSLKKSLWPLLNYLTLKFFKV